MNRKIHFGGIFAISILLALMLLGLRPEPLAEAARNAARNRKTIRMAGA